MIRSILLHTILVLSASSYTYRGYDVCNKQSNCSGCISFAPYCSWCTDQDEQDNRRCRDVSGNQPCNNLINPGDKSDIANVTQAFDFETTDDDDNIIQVKPQSFEAKIRNGSSITFSVTVQPAKDFPLDLYFVMDHSFSMNDTLSVLKESVDAMSEQLKVLTKDHKIGFGTFVDKTTAPYIYTTVNRTKNPCSPNYLCPPAYDFNNTVNLNEYDNFKELIEASRVSASVDLPEAGMDALMQVAVCTEEIGWRKHSRKVIVYLTDTGFHFAGDGKLGGQVERNDGKCWLDDGRTYSKEKTLDYPSVHQVVKKMVDNQMIPIFGVTSKVIMLYEELKGLFPYGAVGELSPDKDKLVKLIVDNYKNISSVIAPLLKKTPQHVKVEHVAHCPEKEGVPNGACSDVSINDTATFTFTVTAEQCLDAEESLEIEFTGFGKVSLDLSTLCTCDCGNLSDQEGNRALCSDHGVFICGACVCEEDYFGDTCNCTGSDRGNIATCTAPDSSVVCSGQGLCLCSRCTNCEGTTYGDYCECDNADCKKGVDGQVCSGHGTCECEQGIGASCKCMEGWSGDDCGCTEDTTDCMFNSKACDGQGVCKCGKCECLKEEYAGKYCHQCPYCDKCEEFKECVLCVAGTSDVGPKEPSECESCDVAFNVSITEERPDTDDITDVAPELEKKHCVYDEEDCQYAAFYMTGPVNQTRRLLYINLDIDCNNAINILWIIVGVVLAVVVLGVFIICLWKCITTYKDKQEYKKFIDDMNMTKFASTQSPLYECPITHVNNPIARKM